MAGTTGLGGLVGWLVPRRDEWYHDLHAPLGTPPDWVFGVVWTILYLLMGVVVAILWDRAAADQRARRALGCFGAQMLLNLAWTPVFFGLQRIDLALWVIVALWVMLVVTIAAARPVSRAAAWMLVPYYAWVSYATYLNVGFYVFNR